VHISQLKPNVRHKKTMLSGLEGLQEIVGLMVMAVSVRAGTDTGWSKKFGTISLYALTL